MQDVMIESISLFILTGILFYLLIGNFKLWNYISFKLRNFTNFAYKSETRKQQKRQKKLKFLIVRRIK